MTELEELIASETSITDVGLENLKPLSKLRLLHLDGTEVGDEGLVHLSALPLQVLDLCGTRVSDAGMPADWVAARRSTSTKSKCAQREGCMMITR